MCDNRDYLVKIEEASLALIAAEGNYAASKADIGTQASVSVRCQCSIQVSEVLKHKN
jgi:hypothetical protein